MEINFNGFILYSLIDNFYYFIFLFFSLISIFSAFMIILSRNPIHSVFFLIISFFCVSALLILLKVEFLPIVFMVVYVGAVSVLFLFVIMMLNIKIIELSENLFNHLPIGSLICFIFFIEFFLFILSDLRVEDSFNLYQYLNDSNNNLSLNEDYIFQYFTLKYNLENFLESSDKNDLFSYESNVNNDLLNNFLFLNYSINYKEISDFNLINKIDVFNNDISIISQIIYKNKFHNFIISSLILLVAMVGSIILTLNRENIVKQQEIYKQVSRIININYKKNKQ